MRIARGRRTQRPRLYETTQAQHANPDRKSKQRTARPASGKALGCKHLNELSNEPSGLSSLRIRIVQISRLGVSPGFSFRNRSYRQNG